MSTESNLNGVDPFAGINITNPIVAKKTTIDEQMRGYRKSMNSPATLDSGKNNEGTVKVNPKDNVLDKNLNDYLSSVVNNFNSVTQQRTDELTPDDLNKFVRVSDDGVDTKIPKVDLLSDISNIFGVNVASNEAIKGELGDNIYRIFNELTVDDNGELLSATGEPLTFNGSWRNGTVAGLVAALGFMGIKQYTKTKDAAVEQAFNEAVFNDAVNNGMIEAYRDLLNRITNEEEKTRIIVNATGVALHKGDYHSFIELLDIAEEDRYPAIKARYPDGPEIFFTHYKLDSKDLQKDHHVIGNRTLDVMKKIWGENYLKIKTSLGWVYNGVIGTNATQDALTVFGHIEELMLLFSIHGLFSRKRSFTVFTEHFPETPIIE